MCSGVGVPSRSFSSRVGCIVGFSGMVWSTVAHMWLGVGGRFVGNDSGVVLDWRGVVRSAVVRIGL